MHPLSHTHLHTECTKLEVNAEAFIAICYDPTKSPISKLLYNIAWLKREPSVPSDLRVTCDPKGMLTPEALCQDCQVPGAPLGDVCRHISIRPLMTPCIDLPGDTGHKRDM
jgi:hypothetical protein